MEVQLYIYDLSRGLAKQFSGPALGFTLDYVPHTSLVWNNQEFFFSGRGIEVCVPGTSYHGGPIQIQSLGKTRHPKGTIDEYVGTLTEMYSGSDYNLFLKNCNNFTNDFAMFLVGHGIPKDILDIPGKVMNTPLGSMLMNMFADEGAGLTGGSSNRSMPAAARNSIANPPPQQHPHSVLDVPNFLNATQRPVTYTKVPPLDKLLTKMGPSASTPAVTSMKNFIITKNASSSGAADHPVPDLPAFSNFMSHALRELPIEVLFTAFDLFRTALIDPRISGFFAEEHSCRTIKHLLSYVNNLGEECPYNLRIVTLHMSCNLFSTPLMQDFVIAGQDIANLLSNLITSSLLDTSHANVRVAAASLAFNISRANYLVRTSSKPHESFPTDSQLELLAAILEAVREEKESKEAVKGLVMAIGYLIYYVPEGSELLELCRAMDAAVVVQEKEGMWEEGDKVIKDIGREVLGTGVVILERD